MKTATQVLKLLRKRRTFLPLLALDANYYSSTQTTGQHTLVHIERKATTSLQGTHSKKTWYSKPKLLFNY